jgi:Carbon storage regulator (could also regulate swarming and quorum sensing)
MLVLSRRESQRIRLGDSIVITVVRVSGDRVRLGIEAPPDVLVLRGELDEYPAGESGTDAVRGHGSTEIRNGRMEIVEMTTL